MHFIITYYYYLLNDDAIRKFTFCLNTKFTGRWQ